MKMTKTALLLMAFTCFYGLSLAGCGGSGESQVIEAPPETTEEPAIEGMSDEDYTKAMDEEMNN